jgi:hypothetical protein
MRNAIRSVLPSIPFNPTHLGRFYFHLLDTWELEFSGRITNQAWDLSCKPHHGQWGRIGQSVATLTTPYTCM